MVLYQPNQLSRGNVAVFDRAGLDAISCGCYRAVKYTYEPILG